MPRTALAAGAYKTIKGPNPGTVNPGDLTFAPVASDNTNGNTFVPAVGDILLIQNTHASLARTITLTSFPDERGRLGTIASYSLAAGEIAFFHFGDLTGWKQSDGTIWLDSSGAEIKYLILRK